MIHNVNRIQNISSPPHNYSYVYSGKLKWTVAICMIDIIIECGAIGNLLIVLLLPRTRHNVTTLTSGYRFFIANVFPSGNRRYSYVLYCEHVRTIQGH